MLSSCHTKDRQHSHHTPRGRALRAHTDGALRARPIGIVVVPFVCGVNVGDLLCGTSIASIQSIESIKSIESIESVESSDSIESIESIQDYRAFRIYRIVRIYSFGTRGFQKNAFFHC